MPWISFFFFQAEDGIRDKLVTGVQTCALPISLDLSSLRACLVTGSVTPASLRDSFERAFGAKLVDSYGSTETCGAITMSRPDAAVPSGSCGQPVPGLAVRLVDPESGRDAGVADEGEVWVRGPSVAVGYHSPDS